MTKDERIKRWEKTRQMGAVKYILFTGVLCWGFPIGYAFAAYRYVQYDILDGAVTVLPFWVLCGVALGAVMWFIAEHLYKKHKPQSETSAETSNG